jgi:hypothetical protein
MIVLYLEALAAIGVALSVLMAGAWTVQQCAGDSGRVGTPRKMFIFLQNQGFGSILLPPPTRVVT